MNIKKAKILSTIALALPASMVMVSSSNNQITKTVGVEATTLSNWQDDGINKITSVEDSSFYFTYSNGDTLVSCSSLMGSNFIVDLTNFPNKITKIGEGCFKNDQTISKIIFGKNITTIGADAFAGNRTITSVVLTNSVTEIDSGAFMSPGLTEINLEDSSITEIKDNVFNSCGISEITIPKTCHKIGPQAFTYCDNLAKVDFSLVDKNVEFIIEYNAFQASPQLAELTNFEKINIPSIPDFCFEYCGFTTIDIPASVKNIGVLAFDQCMSLTQINFRTKSNDLTLTSSSFSNIGGGSKVTLNFENQEMVDYYQNLINDEGNAQGWHSAGFEVSNLELVVNPNPLPDDPINPETPSNNTGIIVGSVVGAIALVAILVSTVVILKRKKNY